LSQSSLWPQDALLDEALQGPIGTDNLHAHVARRAQREARADQVALPAPARLLVELAKGLVHGPAHARELHTRAARCEY